MGIILYGSGGEGQSTVFSITVSFFGPWAIQTNRVALINHGPGREGWNDVANGILNMELENGVQQNMTNRTITTTTVTVVPGIPGTYPNCSALNPVSHAWSFCLQLVVQQSVVHNACSLDGGLSRYQI